MTTKAVTIDGNEAAASVAFRLNEVVAIYPITPSLPMAELCGTWAAAGRKDLWGGRFGASSAVPGHLMGQRPCDSGENAVEIRQHVCEGMEHLGISVDPAQTPVADRSGTGHLPVRGRGAP